MAKVIVTVCGVKVREFETKRNKLPDIAGFLKEMKRLGIKTKAAVSITPKVA